MIVNVLIFANITSAGQLFAKNSAEFNEHTTSGLVTNTGLQMLHPHLPPCNILAYSCYKCHIYEESFYKISPKCM
jgi:hypothetical protein